MDSNLGPTESEATALSTVPQPLHTVLQPLSLTLFGLSTQIEQLVYLLCGQCLHNNQSHLNVPMK